VNGLIGEIAAASREQATGIDQVNQAVNQMDKVTQTNAANAEESAAASQELSAQAEQLRSCVVELSALVGAGSTQAATQFHPPQKLRLSSPSEQASDHATAFRKAA
jgi:methyl-accepting chemotaxis protein